MCGDEYSLELILSTMLQQNDCYSNPDKQDTIMLEAIVAGSRKNISVTLASYHRKSLDLVFHNSQVWTDLIYIFHKTHLRYSWLRGLLLKRLVYVLLWSFSFFLLAFFFFFDFFIMFYWWYASLKHYVIFLLKFLLLLRHYR